MPYNDNLHRARRRGMACAVFILSLLLLTLTGAVSAQDGDAEPPPLTDLNALRAQAAETGSVRVIVGLSVPPAPDGLRAPQADIAAAQQTVAAALGANLRTGSTRITHTYEVIPYMALAVDAAALETLATLPQVTYIQRDVPRPILLDSSTAQINVSGPGGAWEKGATGSGWSVAVLDTGVDRNHPFLSGSVVGEACFGSDAVVQDQYFGYVASPACQNGLTSNSGPGTGVPCTIDGCNHGTHVAGIIASNSATYRGVAPDANIVAVQVFSRFEGSICQTYYAQPQCVLTFDSDQIAAMEYVYQTRNQYNIAAVNLSLGSGRYTDRTACTVENAAMRTAVEALRSVGVAVIAASGNAGYTDSMTAPACITGVISVGAVNDSGTVPNFSNSAPTLDLLAPGVGITSSIPGGGTGTLQGTSMATPHVAGAWVLMKQMNPTATISEIRDRLVTTGTPITDQRSGAGGRIVPLIQVGAAIGEIATHDEMLVNPGFEKYDPVTRSPEGWALTDGMNDRVVCNRLNRPNGLPDKIVAHSGECAFRFRGSPAGENSRLRQTVDTSGLALQAGDLLSIEADVRTAALDPAARIKLRIIYSDGSPMGKLNIPISTTSGYAHVTGSLGIVSGNIQAVRVILQHRGLSGGVLVDDLSLSASDPTRSPQGTPEEVLPLPETSR